MSTKEDRPCPICKLDGQNVRGRSAGTPFTFSHSKERPGGGTGEAQDGAKKTRNQISRIPFSSFHGVMLGATLGTSCSPQGDAE